MSEHHSPQPLFDNEIGKIDSRSEANISTLHPRLQPLARSLVIHCKKAGMIIKIISGTRTIAEQDAIYAQGRTTPGKIVTRVKGGYSNHNFGVAFDVGIFEDNHYIPDSPQYRKIGRIGMDLGLEWGGNWKGLVDEPHFQLMPDWTKKGDLENVEVLALLRERLSKGYDLYA